MILLFVISMLGYAFGVTLIITMGWSIDWSWMENVSVPFWLHTYSIPGTRWFVLSVVEGCAGYIISIVGTLGMDAYSNMRIEVAWIPYVMFVLFGAIMLTVAWNFFRYKAGKIGLTPYGQYWNILFWDILLPVVFGTFVSMIL